MLGESKEQDLYKLKMELQQEQDLYKLGESKEQGGKIVLGKEEKSKKEESH